MKSGGLVGIDGYFYPASFASFCVGFGERFCQIDPRFRLQQVVEVRAVSMHSFRQRPATRLSLISTGQRAVAKVQFCFRQGQ